MEIYILLQSMASSTWAVALIVRHSTEAVLPAWPSHTTAVKHINRSDAKVLLPSAKEVWGKVIFLHQFVILFTGGACVVAGGVRGCSGGAYMVLFRGHAWFYSGACIRGACVVLFGGCMVLFGGCVWFYLGACVVLFGGVCVVFSVFFGYNEIRSMSGQYASYWNAFLF